MVRWARVGALFGVQQSVGSDGERHRRVRTVIATRELNGVHATVTTQSLPNRGTLERDGSFVRRIFGDERVQMRDFTRDADDDRRRVASDCRVDLEHEFGGPAVVIVVTQGEHGYERVPCEIDGDGRTSVFLREELTEAPWGYTWLGRGVSPRCPP
jgi:hypothetical protein